jgi:pimeloyl-[acyl-carrier protein] methyl ester esterase
MRNLNLNEKLNPFIFLPGWGFSISIWDEVIQALKLKNAFALPLPDEEKLDAIMEQLNNQIPEQTTLVGWSLGGLIAIYFCHQFPKKCKRLIVVNSNPKFVASDDWPGITLTQALQFQKQVENREDMIKKFLGIVQYPNRTCILRSTLRKHFLQDTQSQKSLKNYLDFLFEMDFRKYYKKLCMPVTYILGAEDAIVPVALAQRVKFNAEVKIIPHAGHVPFLTHLEIFKVLLCTL